MERFCREELKTFIPYEPVAFEGFLKLNANECPYDLSMDTKKKIAEDVISEDFTRYCDSSAHVLRERLSCYTGYPKDMITVGNGSSEIIHMMLHAFLRPGEKLIAIDPTFTMYIVIARAAGIQSVEIPVGDGFRVDVDQMIDAARREQAKLIFLCTPNNPTGNAIPRADIEKVIRETDCLVVLDEAYGEFAEESFLSCCKDSPRVIILRTLSKAFGLAGLRVGYGIADPVVIREINKVRLPYNLNALSQKVATYVLDDIDYLEEKVTLIKKERQRVYDALNAISGVQAYPSEANYILYRTDREANIIMSGMHDRKILIRDFSSHPLLPGCVRVTIGKPEDNDCFISAMKQIMEG